MVFEKKMETNLHFPSFLGTEMAPVVVILARGKLGPVYPAYSLPWPLTRYLILWVAYAPGIPGTFQMKPVVSDSGMYHATCMTHVPWCMSESLIRGDGENLPGIPGACATRNLRYLVRGPWLLMIWPAMGRSHVQQLHCPSYYAIFRYPAPDGSIMNSNVRIRKKMYAYLRYWFHWVAGASPVKAMAGISFNGVLQSITWWHVVELLKNLLETENFVMVMCRVVHRYSVYRKTGTTQFHFQFDTPITIMPVQTGLCTWNI